MTGNERNTLTGPRFKAALLIQALSLAITEQRKYEGKTLGFDRDSGLVSVWEEMLNVATSAQMGGREVKIVLEP